MALQERLRPRDPLVREFLLTFWKIHVLRHAAEKQGVYGQWMLEELARHGYRLSPGTLYPLLTRMCRRGWIRAGVPERSTAPRVYRITAAGSAVLMRLRASIGELQDEIGRSSAQAIPENLRVLPQKGRHRSKPPAPAFKLGLAESLTGRTVRRGQSAHQGQTLAPSSRDEASQPNTEPAPKRRRAAINV
jgi:PadR family transcriptional regulator, regulatory protein PadR